MDETLQKGMQIELLCLQKFIELGYYCSIPYGDCCKYDIVVDIDNKLLRVQCKASRWVTDTAEKQVAFHFSTYRQTTNTKQTTRYRYMKNEIDFFYTYFNGEHYLIPIEDVKGEHFRMRYKYPNSNQTQGINLEKKYRLINVLQTILKQEEV